MIIIYDRIAGPAPGFDFHSYRYIIQRERIRHRKWFDLSWTGLKRSEKIVETCSVYIAIVVAYRSRFFFSRAG